jgi:pimeloyl-ACP methyl ester carboxylesterase
MIRDASIVTSSDGTWIAYEAMGEGDGLIVLGGALRAANDYHPLAEALSASYSVVLVERRGRGRSGPQGEQYHVEREIEDLLAVQAEVGARAVFGHSYGGLVALEASRRGASFRDVIAYEPGVSIAGSIPSDWTDRYQELLRAGDARGAFAAMARGAGFAPLALTRTPERLARMILRVAVRGAEWARMEPLLAASGAEHEQLAKLDDGSAARFRAIPARVLLLGGSKSPAFITTELFEQLRAAIPDLEIVVIPGLDHTGPEKQPRRVAEFVEAFLRGER